MPERGKCSKTVQNPRRPLHPRRWQVIIFSRSTRQRSDNSMFARLFCGYVLILRKFFKNKNYDLLGFNIIKICSKSICFYPAE